MGNVYIVYYDFRATSGNHAGMAHLVNLLGTNITNVKPVKSLPHHFKGGQYLARVYAIWLAIYFRFVLGKNDKVFFFEYFTKGTAFQALTAKAMRLLGIRQPIYALIHLSGQHLLELYKTEDYIREKLQPVDKIVVLGSSLAAFLKNLDIGKEIVTTFHYVDTDYYKPAIKSVSIERLQVIFIGNLKRNFSLLQSIVTKAPAIDFHVLMGRNNLQSLFEKVENVKLYPFLTEEKMLHLMQQCDVSLSVMEDTVGSNVITTSMAAGLVQVVSDVGSIRDYCDESNAFFCCSEDDFLTALDRLDNNRALLQQMRQATLQRATALSHQTFIHQFREML